MLIMKDTLPHAGDLTLVGKKFDLEVLQGTPKRDLNLIKHWDYYLFHISQPNPEVRGQGQLSQTTKSSKIISRGV